MSLFIEEKILTKIPAKNKDAVPFVIAFPNTYSLGIASLGFQNAWKSFSQSKDLRVTRWFTDIQEKSSLPPIYVGFSFSWELDYMNIFKILKKNNIAICTRSRDEDSPIIFCGGQVPNANPEPFCNNFDFFLIGDLEVVAENLINKIIEVRHLKRSEKLEELSKLDGVYMPHKTAHYIPINRQFTKGNLSSSSILTPNCVWPNTFLIEVVRGCPEHCRFCLSSYSSLKFRAGAIKESLIPQVDFGLQHTSKIGLLGASITQHPQFEDLVDHLLTKSTSITTKKLQVQIASVRADTITKSLASGLYRLGAKNITIAVETGSSRLRNIINKKVSTETIINSIETIYNAGFDSVKLYGIVGLPFETQEDLEQTVDLLKQIKSRNKTKKLIWSLSVFVPKASTPFQVFGIDPNTVGKMKYLRKELHQIGVDFRAESYRWALIQALISRGDRKVNKILELAYIYGGTLGSFNRAIKENKEEADSNFFIYQKWDENLTLPWDNIQGHLNKKIVQEHTRKALAYV